MAKSLGLNGEELSPRQEVEDEKVVDCLKRPGDQETRDSTCRLQGK
jgi:hypothetical protein